MRRSAIWAIPWARSEDTNGGYLRSFYNIPARLTGHAVSSLVGGGTNNPEYDLLTGRHVVSAHGPRPV